MYQINLTFLIVRLVSNIRVYIYTHFCFVLIFKNLVAVVFFYVQQFGYGADCCRE